MNRNYMVFDASNPQSFFDVRGWIGAYYVNLPMVILQKAKGAYYFLMEKLFEKFGKKKEAAELRKEARNSAVHKEQAAVVSSNPSSLLHHEQHHEKGSATVKEEKEKPRDNRH